MVRRKVIKTGADEEAAAAAPREAQEGPRRRRILVKKRIRPAAVTSGEENEVETERVLNKEADGHRLGQFLLPCGVSSFRPAGPFLVLKSRF